jgi:hypothetical protein
MINLSYEVIESTPADISNMTVFALDQKTPFDAANYAEWAHIDAAEFSADDLAEINAAQSVLGKDFWMLIDHKDNG